MKINQTKFMKLCLADALIKIMNKKEFDKIEVSEICTVAQIGRSTFYRHFGNKNKKEELIIFKIIYEWEQYKENHKKEVIQDKGFAMMNYIYDNQSLFSLIYNHGLISTLLQIFEKLMLEDTKPNLDDEKTKKDMYIFSYFTYAYFGIIYQWIKYDFAETPLEIQSHIANSFQEAINSSDSKNNQK